MLDTRLTDNLPVATPYTAKDGSEQYDSGYMLGSVSQDGSVALHNHLEFTVRYHDAEGQHRVVGFEVIPRRYVTIYLIALH